MNVWEDRAALEALLRLLRSSGVRYFEAGGLHLEFGADPMAGDAAPAPVPVNLGAGEKKCACGHLQDSEHNNDGLCIAGACPYTVCHPEATPKPPAV